MALELEDTSQKGWTVWLLFSCVTVAASASFAIGYGIAAPNQFGAYVVATTNSAQVNTNTDEKSYTKDFINALPQTLFTITSAIGALTGMKWHSIGRLHSRRKVFYANFPFMYLSILFVFIAYHSKKFFIYLISRIFHGYQAGMACAIVPPYINEISSRKVRGSAGVIHQLFITIGILTAQVMGIPPLLGRNNRWHWGFAVGGLTCVISNFFIKWLPESPIEQYIQHSNELGATATLKKLRDAIDVSKEMNNLKQEASERTEISATLSILQLIRCRRLRWPLIISMTLLGGQALSGINAVFYYSTEIFKKAGISDEMMPYAVMLTGLINVIATIVAVYMMEKLGRKALIIWPGCGMLIIFALLIILIQANKTAQSKNIAWVCVILTLIYVLCFAVGLGPVPFLYCTEVFRHEARDAALILGLILNYFFNTLLSLLFPIVNSVLEGYVFAIFLIIVALQLTLFWFKMPETKNKKIEDIERFWNIEYNGNIDIPETFT